MTLRQMIWQYNEQTNILNLIQNNEYLLTSIYFKLTHFSGRFLFWAINLTKFNRILFPINMFKYQLELLLFLLCIETSVNATKNVLFIIVDDLRPALGCFDDLNAITPNMDQLAGKSAVFQHTYAQVIIW